MRLERETGVTIVRDLQLDGLCWRRQSMYEHYNWQIESLGARSSAPRTPRQLFGHPRVGPIVRQLGRHPLLRFGPPVRVPNLHGRSYRRTLRHNQQLFEQLRRDARVTALITVTTPMISRIPTLAQVPHLTVPAGAIEADRDLARYGFVPGSRVPWGLSILGGPRAEHEVLSVGHVIERCLDARVQPLPHVDGTCLAAEHAGDGEHAIRAFNQLKKQIAYRCFSRLQLDPLGRVYVHPTAEEFRWLVRKITDGLTQAG